MRKIIIGISILSLVLTAGVIAVEASDENDSWRETIKAKMAEFKEMTPEERKLQKEEAMAAMENIKNLEEWQNANKEEKREMLKELDIFPLRGHGKAFGKGFMKGYHKGMEGCECVCEQDESNEGDENEDEE
ncbi:MAG: hypothetical protein U9P90_03160 [Patescibacteria group bacterium]|nr:hypothetical protein [Patescibacteria group bacterium]